MCSFLANLWITRLFVCVFFEYAHFTLLDSGWGNHREILGNPELPENKYLIFLFYFGSLLQGSISVIMNIGVCWSDFSSVHINSSSLLLETVPEFCILQYSPDACVWLVSPFFILPWKNSMSSSSELLVTSVPRVWLLFFLLGLWICVPSGLKNFSYPLLLPNSILSRSVPLRDLCWILGQLTLSLCSSSIPVSGHITLKMIKMVNYMFLYFIMISFFF